VGKTLYVGNLSFNVTNAGLEEMFAAHGTVASAFIVMDRETKKPKGFGFVEMGSEVEAQDAIRALNGSSLDGRDITVSEAKPKPPAKTGTGGGGSGRPGANGAGRRDGPRRGGNRY
jgi:RNA recognition motif-containing protein